MDKRYLLKWLGDAEYSQYGECFCNALDELIADGLAQVHEEGAHQSGFIARGRGKMFCAVSLTAKGREELAKVVGSSSHE